MRLSPSALSRGRSMRLRKTITRDTKQYQNGDGVMRSKELVAGIMKRAT
jgi:hypothetical protein